MNNTLVYLVAGEASGDALGADLMQSLKALKPNITFAGIGGDAMEAEGLHSLFPYNKLSVMGFVEVVPHIPAMLRRIRETAQDIALRRPSVVITIDSPGFTFRLAKKLIRNPATASIPRVHYVAPSVWAYKPGRALKTAHLFDMLLTLLPFEPPYFTKLGMDAVFVGHPVLWDDKKGDAIAFRLRHAIEKDAPLLLLLPGSRRGEIGYHLALFLKAAGTLPDFTPVILAGAQVKNLIQQQAPETLIVDISEKRDAFAAAGLALTKSGTISLELAAAKVPIVVAHRGNPLSAWLVKRMILIRYVSLVNIAMDSEIIPELLQEHCNIKEIGGALQTLVTPEAQAFQRGQYAAALKKLRGSHTQPPGLIAAEHILKQLKYTSASI